MSDLEKKELFTAEQIFNICAKALDDGADVKMLKALRDPGYKYEDFRSAFPHLVNDEEEFKALRVIAAKCGSDALAMAADCLAGTAPVV